MPNDTPELTDEQLYMMSYDELIDYIAERMKVFCKQDIHHMPDYEAFWREMLFLTEKWFNLQSRGIKAERDE